MKTENLLIGISPSDTIDHVNDVLELLRCVDMSGKMGCAFSESAEMGVFFMLNAAKQALLHAQAEIDSKKVKAA